MLRIIDDGAAPSHRRASNLRIIDDSQTAWRQHQSKRMLLALLRKHRLGIPWIIVSVGFQAVSCATTASGMMSVISPIFAFTLAFALQAAVWWVGTSIALGASNTQGRRKALFVSTWLLLIASTWTFSFSSFDGARYVKDETKASIDYNAALRQSHLDALLREKQQATIGLQLANADLQKHNLHEDEYRTALQQWYVQSALLKEADQRVADFKLDSASAKAASVAATAIAPVDRAIGPLRKLFGYQSAGRRVSADQVDWFWAFLALMLELAPFTTALCFSAHRTDEGEESQSIFNGPLFPSAGGA